MKLINLPLILAVLATSLAAQEDAKSFRFGGKPANGEITVTAVDRYSPEKGFGFEPGAAPACSPQETRRPACSSGAPFYFSVTVPEGNHRVTVTFGNEQSSASNVVKAELRRLMLERIDTRPGEFLKRSFIVNVRTPRIATGDEVKLKDRERTSEQWAWDEKLTLEFNGSRPSISALDVQRVDVPTVFILGDSTVADQPGEPYASWGQMITRFFKEKIAIANHAESGESLKSSVGAGRLEKVLSLIKPGDYLLIQYGHNDQKERGEGIGAFTSYKASLKEFVRAARSKRAVPMLISSMHRRTFDARGRVTNSHGDYPEAVRQSAKEESVALIDLHAMSKDLYEAFGPEGSGQLFKEGDGTHHNAFGAYQIAKMIVQSIQDQRLPLSKYLMNSLARYDPRKPDDPKTFALPGSPAVAHAKPLGS